MTKDKFLQSLTDTFTTCLDTAKKKNADYAGSGDPFANFKLSEVADVPVERGMLVRIMDKIARVSNLLDSEAQVKDEKITDTLLDAINYLAILKAYLERDE